MSKTSRREIPYGDKEVARSADPAEAEPQPTRPALQPEVSRNSILALGRRPLAGTAQRGAGGTGKLPVALLQEEIAAFSRPVRRRSHKWTSCEASAFMLHCWSHCQTLRRPRSLVSSSVSARESSGSGHSCRTWGGRAELPARLPQTLGDIKPRIRRDFSLSVSRASASASDPRGAWRNSLIRS